MNAPFPYLLDSHMVIEAFFSQMLAIVRYLSQVILIFMNNHEFTVKVRY